MTPDIEATRRACSTVYYAAELGIRTAEVVHEPEGWDIRCYYGAGGPRRDGAIPSKP